MLDSPARSANILHGDVITRINDRQVTGARSCIDAIRAFAGQEVAILVYRNGEEIELKTKLNRP